MRGNIPPKTIIRSCWHTYTHTNTHSGRNASFILMRFQPAIIKSASERSRAELPDYLISFLFYLSPSFSLAPTPPTNTPSHVLHLLTNRAILKSGTVLPHLSPRSLSYVGCGGSRLMCPPFASITFLQTDLTADLIVCVSEGDAEKKCEHVATVCSARG